MTFVSFLNEVRIEKITEMISTGNYTIKELAEKTGFQEPTYLCKVIKRRTGKTIGELKRMYAQQISG